MCLDNELWEVESSRQPSWSQWTPKKFSVSKKHSKYVIFPINFCEFPSVEIFSCVNFSDKNPATAVVRFNKATVKARLTLVRMLYEVKN